MKNMNEITETILLPSAGSKIYGQNFDGSLTLRAMTTKEEKVRTSATPSTFYEIMRTIINDCIVDNKKENGEYKIDSANFTDFDFYAVCVKLRILSYGDKYKTEAICTKCGRKFDYVADLSTLMYNLVPEDFEEPYQVGPLPRSGDVLTCRMLRVKDRIDIEKQAQTILAKDPTYVGDPRYLLEMERRIVSVNGEPLDFITAPEYVENMIAMDSDYYHYMVDKDCKDFGVIRINMTDCQNPAGCDGTAMWAVRPDTEFFRAYFADRR